MSATCGTCGAADDGELVICKFCEQPLSDEIVKTAVPCPSCATPNRAGKQHCMKCQQWLIVTCVFCAQFSPCNVPLCVACKEPFAGAIERKQERDRAKAAGNYSPGASLSSATSQTSGIDRGNPPRMPPY